MPTDGSADRFEFAPVAGRAVVAGFDGGTITSDAGALLLGATDRAIGLGLRRDGKPDQGMPARPVRRPHVHQSHAVQSTATLVRGHGLCSDRSPAPDRAPDDPARPGHGGNHSTAAAQDRGAGAPLGATGHGRHGLRPPLAARLGHRRSHALRPRSARGTPHHAIRGNADEPICIRGGSHHGRCHWMSERLHQFPRPGDGTSAGQNDPTGPELVRLL